MRRTVILCGTASFVMAFLGGLLAFAVVVPRPATAQSTVLPEVRAASFALVDPEGTVLATLERTPLGNGNLTLYDNAGRRRTALSVGVVTFFDGEGTAVLRAGRAEVTSREGLPPVNGVLLGPDGSIGMLPATP
jgi:hypothetical protein